MANKSVIVILLGSLLLTGCASKEGLIQSLTPVCTALGAPLKYNPNNKNSPVHAGPALAKQIDQRDDVAENLHCPGY